MQKITFTSLFLDHLDPARIIAALGMDEGKYPRVDERSSFCQMTTDEIPSRSDEDRALFLEMIAKAGDYLLFSYQRIHPEDGKPQEASLLIEELDQYLRKQGLESGIIKIDHPASSFDPSYFSPDSKVKKWAHSDYLNACASSGGINPETTDFFPALSDEVVCPQESTIDIRQLKKLARHPLQFYFNETLKIYLNQERDEEESDFLISGLQKSLYRKKAFGTDSLQLVEQMTSEGKLPRGLFQKAAALDLDEEITDLLEALKTFNVQPEEIFNVHFFLSCQEREQQMQWMPPLEIILSDSKVVYLTGKLEGLSPKGLLFHGDRDLKDLVKVWPVYLIYCCLYPKSRSLLLTKKGVQIEIPIDDPKAALASYIEYSLLAKQSPSPLMPDFAKAILNGTLEDVKAAMDKDLTYEDPYLNYLKRRSALPSLEKNFPLWDENFKRTFAPLLEFFKKSPLERRL